MKKQQMLTKIVFAVIFVAAVLVIAGCMLSGCNKQILDTTYHYDYAILSLPNGRVIEGKVTSWTDFDDGDQIQVKVDGVVYLVHSANIVLEDR